MKGVPKGLKKAGDAKRPHPWRGMGAAYLKDWDPRTLATFHPARLVRKTVFAPLELVERIIDARKGVAAWKKGQTDFKVHSRAMETMTVEFETVLKDGTIKKESVTGWDSANGHAIKRHRRRALRLWKRMLAMCNGDTTKAMRLFERRIAWLKEKYRVDIERINEAYILAVKSGLTGKSAAELVQEEEHHGHRVHWADWSRIDTGIKRPKKSSGGH